MSYPPPQGNQYPNQYNSGSMYKEINQKLLVIMLL